MKFKCRMVDAGSMRDFTSKISNFCVSNLVTDVENV